MLIDAHVNAISTPTYNNTSIRTALDDIPSDGMREIWIIHRIRCIASVINYLNTLIFKVFCYYCF